MSSWVPEPASDAHARSAVGWWCGIVGVVLVSAGFFVIDEGGSTGPDGPISVLVHEITDNRGRIVIGSLVGMVGCLVLVGLGAAIRLRLASHDANRELVGHLGFAFAVIAAVGGIAHGSLRLAAATVQDSRVLTETMRTIAMLKEHSPDMLFLGVLGLVVTMSLASWHVRLVSRPMAWVGLMLAVATLALIPTDHGGIGAALLPWLVVACVRLLRRAPLPRRGSARGD